MNVKTTVARNAVVLASVPVAMLLLTGTASAAGTSGDPSKPQPLSSADRNGTGANPGTLDGCGAYCSTRDGSGSLNGRNDTTQSSKPCAGCVGKADNKNPKGQAPSGPVDSNAGYECDRNQGIGQGNPAHTGCTAAPVTPPVAPPVTPPVDTPPVAGPPAVTPPVDAPPVSSPGEPGTPPVCATDAAMAAGSEAGCTPATAGSGSTTTTPGTTTPGTTTPGTTTPGTASPGTTAPAGPKGSTTGSTTTAPATDPATDPATTAGSGTVSGQSSDRPVVLAGGSGTANALGGGSGAAAQSPTGLPFTGDSTGQLAVFALVLVTAGGGLVIGARRV